MARYHIDEYVTDFDGPGINISGWHDGACTNNNCTRTDHLHVFTDDDIDNLAFQFGRDFGGPVDAAHFLARRLHGHTSGS